MLSKFAIVAMVVAAVISISALPSGASTLTTGSDSRHSVPGGQSCGDATCVEDFVAACTKAGGLTTAADVGGGGVELECKTWSSAKPWPGGQSCGDIHCVSDFVRACSNAGGKAVILGVGGGYHLTCGSIYL